MIEWVVEFSECVGWYSLSVLTFFTGFLKGRGWVGSRLRNMFMSGLVLIVRAEV
jgi:hypothetical protein